ncbi:MAG: MFS transporter [Kiloniellales bacterium]|nr:MFS transporter [Kiloniellales bacterium]
MNASFFLWLRRSAAKLRPDENATSRDFVFGRLWLLRNGISSQAMETLAAGPFLAACAIYLGASNLTIGLLAAVPHLAQLIQLVGVYLVERFHTRRLIAVLSAIPARFAYVAMIAAMLVPSTDTALALLVIAVALRYALGAVVSAAWNAWIPEIVPLERRSEFFGKRLRVMAVVGTGLSLGAAALVDWWSANSSEGFRNAYIVLFALAFFCGLHSAYCMARMPEPKMGARAKKLPLARVLAKPILDMNFRRLILFLGTWNFAVNLASPFFVVYMLRRLGLDLTLVTVFIIVSQLANVLTTAYWGRIADRYSNKSVLAVSGPLFIGCIFAWTFTTFPEPHFFTIPLLVVIHILTGVATAGVTLASTTIGMKLAPKAETTGYLACSSMVVALASGLAPIIGGLTADFFVNRELSLVLHWTAPDGERDIPALFVSQWDFFFLLAAVLGLYSVHRLSLIREEGEVEERIIMQDVLSDTRRSIRNISSIAGLKAASELPISMIQRLLRQRPQKRPTRPPDP